MAYYKRNEFELSIPINDLKPGMQVCIPRNITYGWNVYTGLTLYKPYTIKRVTPKKTKVICEDGTEFYTKETAFLLPVPEMNIENERVFLFQKIGKIITALDRSSCKTYISSYEEMKEAADHLTAFYDFCLKDSQKE